MTNSEITILKAAFIPLPYVSYHEAWRSAYHSLYLPIDKDEPLNAFFQKERKDYRERALHRYNHRDQALDKYIPPIAPTFWNPEVKKDPINYLLGNGTTNGKLEVTANVYERTSYLDTMKYGRTEAVRNLLLQTLFDCKINAYAPITETRHCKYMRKLSRVNQNAVEAITPNSIWGTLLGAEALRNGTILWSHSTHQKATVHPIWFLLDELTKAFPDKKNHANTTPTNKVDRVANWYRGTYPRGHSSTSDVLKTVLEKATESLNETVSVTTLRTAIKRVKGKTA